MISLLQVQKFRGKTGDHMADKNYLHTAYANSADGTYGFTTVYPNLNLWKNSKLQSYTSKGASTNISSLIYQLDASGLNIIGVPMNIYYDYEITNSSGTWSGNINPFYGFRGDTSSSVSSSNLKGTFNKKLVLISANTSCAIMASGLPTGTVVNIKNLKMEIGSTATPWMSSSSEVTTADWPNYIGTYVDTNPTSSTEPSKYDWDEMKYRVYLDGVPVGGSKLLSFDLENLKAGTSYNVQVSQINGNIESDKSESVAFKTTLTK